MSLHPMLEHGFAAADEDQPVRCIECGGWSDTTVRTEHGPLCEHCAELRGIDR